MSVARMAYSSRLAGILSAWPILPLLGFLAFFFVFPVVQLLVLGALDASNRLSLENFQRIATTPVYLKVMAITFEVSAWTMIISLLVAYPVAFLLASTKERTRNLLLMLVVLPFWTSFLVRTFAWMILLGENGAINTLLRTLGIVEQPLALMYNFTGVMIGTVHALAPLAALTILSVMQNIDANLVKAARTLGAPGGQAFWRIYFPLSLPGVVAAALLVFVTSLGYFIAPALLGSARQTMIAQVMISQIKELLNWRFASALAVVLLILSAIVFFLYDLLFGMSTLSGSGTAQDNASQQEGGAVGRVAGAAGRLLLAGLGRCSDFPGLIAGRLLPSRVGRARRLAGSRLALWSVALAFIAFLSLPTLIVIPVSFTQGDFVEFPPEGFSTKWYETYFGSQVWMEATIRSLTVALAVGALSTALGTAAAFALARQAMIGKTAIMTLILSPLLIPRIIIAVALFYLFARMGLIGTNLGLALGHTVIAVPYVVITVMAVLKNYDIRLDQAAWSLGASKWKTLVHITLPQIQPGLVAGFLFAFVTSFDDLTLALFMSSGLSTTLPKQIWTDLLQQVAPTLAAVSTVILVGISTFIICAELMRRRGGSR